MDKGGAGSCRYRYADARHFDRQLLSQKTLSLVSWFIPKDSESALFDIAIIQHQFKKNKLIICFNISNNMEPV